MEDEEIEKRFEKIEDKITELKEEIKKFFLNEIGGGDSGKPNRNIQLSKRKQ